MTDRPAPNVIVAIDTADLPKAEELAKALAPEVYALKVGSTLFAAHGPEAILEIGQHGRVFVDLKFHDIPNQVEGAVAEMAKHQVWMLTVHASGGVGKSVLANRLGLHMPDGSVAIIFDGFAGGSYRAPRTWGGRTM